MASICCSHKQQCHYDLPGVGLGPFCYVTQFGLVSRTVAAVEGTFLMVPVEHAPSSGKMGGLFCFPGAKQPPEKVCYYISKASLAMRPSEVGQMGVHKLMRVPDSCLQPPHFLPSHVTMHLILSTRIRATMPFPVLLWPGFIAPGWVLTLPLWHS